jgi:hypothetical protein
VVRRDACFNFRVTTFASATFAVFALVAAGCGGSSTSADPPPATTHAPPPAKTPATTTTATASGGSASCRDAPATLMRRIHTHFVLEGGTLSHAQIVPAIALPGIYFVSARIDGGGTRDKIGTWATERLGATGPVYAVDSWAALVSTYVAASQRNLDLSVHDPGAYKSRVCVGGPNVPKGNDAAPSGRPATGG